MQRRDTFSALFESEIKKKQYLCRMNRLNNYILFVHAKRLIWLLWLPLLCWSSCHRQSPSDPLPETDAATRYATLLQMQDVEKGVTLCRLQNPWQPDRIAIQYLLHDQSLGSISDEQFDEWEEHFGPFQSLKVPLSRQTVCASSHLWLLNELHALSSVSVACDLDYILSPAVRSAIRDLHIQDGGTSNAPNAEVIKAAASPCIWISPYEAVSQQIVSVQLPDLPIIYCADYMESSPLARAEWMRFYGRLVGRTAQADSLFSAVEQHYHQLAEPYSDTATVSVATRPMLLPDLPYGATWYVPGGCSSMGIIYQDAGFRYLWSEDKHGGSLSLAPEAVYERACEAEVWVFKHFAPAEENFSREWLLAQNPLYSRFDAAQSGRIYGCNTAFSDYFDVVPFRPDWLLEEMQNIREKHDDKLRYFHPLK